MVEMCDTFLGPCVIMESTVVQLKVRVVLNRCVFAGSWSGIEHLCDLPPGCKSFGDGDILKHGCCFCLEKIDLTV